MAIQKVEEVAEEVVGDASPISQALSQSSDYHPCTR